jgi:3-oxoacyl-[acyl-carrier protein] reductase
MTSAPAATIISGGGRGIGRAVMVRMAREGPVIAVGRTLADLESVCREVVDAGGVAGPCAGDVRDPGTAAHAIALAADHGWTVRNLALG